MSSEQSSLRLTVIQANTPPQQLTLPPQPLITLGRATECTVPIRDRYLSRKHAELAFDGEQWFLRDCGSANGTMLNGVRVADATPLKPGDHIVLGDTEVVFEPEGESNARLLALDHTSHARSIVLPVLDVIDDTRRIGVLASVAMQFIEARPTSELFDFILDRVMEFLRPSRAAIALLGRENQSFTDVHVRRSDATDTGDLIISKTLLREVVEGRSVVSFVDTSQDERLARAESIIAQQIRSAVCAPLLAGDTVIGVLYLDFLASHGAIAHEDVRLIAQIASFAAVKFESTRNREEAVAKQRLDEELRTAYTIQSRLLPSVLPAIDGYVFAGTNKPVRTVSGDYYDVITRPNGKIYFVIADVSGKGITAALVMASMATAFEIFTRTDPPPDELVSQLNQTLVPKTGPTKFVTLVAGLLDPATGVVEFTNAGHVPPLVICRDQVTTLDETDIIVGLFPSAKYHRQTVTLGPGDSLVLFTDGVTEAEDEDEAQLGLEPIAELMKTYHGTEAPRLLETIEEYVRKFMGTAPATDDVTMLALTRTQ
ncbi:MAG TPA: SpoIIE family protein phosphatase [Thermoanaerobaculia bacterium]